MTKVSITLSLSYENVKSRYKSLCCSRFRLERFVRYLLWVMCMDCILWHWIGKPRPPPEDPTLYILRHCARENQPLKKRTLGQQLPYRQCPPPPPYMVIQVDTAISSWRLVVQTIKCGKGPGPANGTDYSNMTAQSKVYAC